MTFLKKFSSISLVLLLITSCGVKKKISTTKKINTPEKTISSAEKVITQHDLNKSNLNTFSAKISTFFDNGKTSTSGTISLRMERGKVIWLSISKLGFTIAKAKITPSRVQYYEKWHKLYFDGDFSLITKKLGIPLSFEQLENLLLGQSVVELSNKPYRFNIKQDNYKFELKKPYSILEYMLFIRSDNFKIKKQSISKKDKSAIIYYNKYQSINTQIIPKDVTIKALSSFQKTLITLTYKNVEIGKTLRFPFHMPQGYKKIEL